MIGNDEENVRSEGGVRVTRQYATELLALVPPRPKRQLDLRDHVFAVTTIVMALVSGLLALSGHPWMAILPAAVAITTSSGWTSGRKNRPNEPRFKVSIFATMAVASWLTLPIWRGITRGETIPFPEAWVMAGLAPAAWLLFYIVLLIRR